MKTYRLKVPDSDIQNYYFTDAKVEFVLVDDTITEVRDYDGSPVFNADVVEVPIKVAELVAFRNNKRKLEKVLKEKCKKVS